MRKTVLLNGLVGGVLIAVLRALPMKKIVLTFGIISGVIMSALTFTSVAFHEQIGFDNGLIVGYTAMVLAFLLILFGVRSYRDNAAPAA